MFVFFHLSPSVLSKPPALYSSSSRSLLSHRPPYGGARPGGSGGVPGGPGGSRRVPGGSGGGPGGAGGGGEGGSTVRWRQVKLSGEGVILLKSGSKSSLFLIIYILV